MNGVDPNWLPSDGNASGRNCLRHRRDAQPVSLKAKPFKAAVKRQLRAMAERMQHAPATSADLEDLALTLNNRRP